MCAAYVAERRQRSDVCCTSRAKSLVITLSGTPPPCRVGLAAALCCWTPPRAVTLESGQVRELTVEPVRARNVTSQSNPSKTLYTASQKASKSLSEKDTHINSNTHDTVVWCITPIIHLVSSLNAELCFALNTSSSPNDLFFDGDNDCFVVSALCTQSSDLPTTCTNNRVIRPISKKTLLLRSANV